MVDWFDYYLLNGYPKLKSTADRRLGLLRRYEWIDVFIDNGGHGDKWIKQCLCCKSERNDGHADGCEMDAECNG